MRVSTGMLYNLTQSRLGRVASDLQDATHVVSSGKRINLLSDDPVGLSHVIDLNSTIANIGQLEKNISTGRQWLTSGESTLRSSQDGIDQAKVLAISMASGIKGDVDRLSAAQEVDGILKRMLDLGNSQVNGQYVFSGTRSDEKPFAFDNESDPSRVLYNGNSSAFKIKVSNTTDIEVGHVGETVFQRDRIDIDDSNNKIDFREFPNGSTGYGEQLTASLPFGSYTKEELGEIIESALEQRSEGVGLPRVINVSNHDVTAVVDNYAALPQGGAGPITATFDGTAWTATGSTAVALTHKSDENEAWLDFSGDGKGDLRLRLDTPATAGFAVGFSLDTAANGGNDIAYDVSYDAGTKKFRIAQDGSASPVALDNLEFLWKTGTHAGSAIGPEIGYDFSSDHVVAAPSANTYESDDPVEWSAFHSLIELKGYLERSDTDGINRSLARLNSDFDHLSSVVSDSGIKEGRLDVRESVLADLKLSGQSNRKEIEEADILEAASDLVAKRSAYEAALSASSKVMNISLVNFL